MGWGGGAGLREGSVWRDSCSTVKHIPLHSSPPAQEAMAPHPATTQPRPPARAGRKRPARPGRTRPAGIRWQGRGWRRSGRTSSTAPRRRRGRPGRQTPRPASQPTQFVSGSAFQGLHAPSPRTCYPKKNTRRQTPSCPRTIGLTKGSRLSRPMTLQRTLSAPSSGVGVR